LDNGKFEEQLRFVASAPTTQLWQFTPQHPSRTEYSWQATYLKHDGSLLAMDRAYATDASLVLPRWADMEEAQRTVRVVAELVEWATVRSVTVALRYSDPASALQFEEQLKFAASAPTTQVWQFTPVDPSRTEYSWQATYLKHDGSLVALNAQQTTDESLVLPSHAG
jgi:NH3-dependent NAD+ synthetase